MASQNPSASSPPAPDEAQRRRARLLRLGLVGLAGAVTVTILNEGVRRVVPHAPRIEVIGERALAGSLEALHVAPPGARPCTAGRCWAIWSPTRCITAWWDSDHGGAPGDAAGRSDWRRAWARWCCRGPWAWDASREPGHPGHRC